MAPRKYVFAVATATVRHDGQLVRVRKGDVWAGDDPFVKAHPEMFSNEPDSVRRTVAPVAKRAPVETATAEPGVQRAGW